MATESIQILVTRSTNQKSITVTDNTDWIGVNGTIDDFTDIVLNFYTTDTSSAVESYTFTPEEVIEYVSNSTISLDFEDVFRAEYIQDNWYIVQMVVNTDDFVSDYDGFGTYIYLKTKVYELINSLHTPTLYRAQMEKIYQLHMFIRALEYLDTSEVLSRDVRFKKILIALTKMVS